MITELQPHAHFPASLLAAAWRCLDRLDRLRGDFSFPEPALRRANEENRPGLDRRHLLASGRVRQRLVFRARALQRNLTSGPLV